MIQGYGSYHGIDDAVDAQEIQSLLFCMSLDGTCLYPYSTRAVGWKDPT